MFCFHRNRFVLKGGQIVFGGSWLRPFFLIALLSSWAHLLCVSINQRSAASIWLDDRSGGSLLAWTVLFRRCVDWSGWIGKELHLQQPAAVNGEERDSVVSTTTPHWRKLPQTHLLAVIQSWFSLLPPASVWGRAAGLEQTVLGACLCQSGYTSHTRTWETYRNTHLVQNYSVKHTNQIALHKNRITLALQAECF